MKKTLEILKIRNKISRSLSTTMTKTKTEIT